MQNYNTDSNSQMLSFDLGGGIWRHVTIIGRVGIDQHGDKWFLLNDKLYSEFSPRIIDVKHCFIPKNVAA